MSPLTSLKWGSDTKICCFSQKFRPKAIKSQLQVALSKNFQWQSCSTINYLSNGINILGENDPIPKNLGLKALTANRKDVCFTFHTRRAVQSAIADPVSHVKHTVVANKYGELPQSRL